MAGSRIGIIGGLSWESTASYYRYFNQLFSGANEWSQPQLLLDSVDFGAIVPLQREGNWEATGEILADAARRLERAGATVLGIGANTMHVNFAQVQNAVAIPVVDVRDAIAKESTRTRPLDAGVARYEVLESTASSTPAWRCRSLGVTSIKPTEEQTERLQFIIFSESDPGHRHEAVTCLLARSRDVLPGTGRGRRWPHAAAPSLECSWVKTNRSR